MSIQGPQEPFGTLPKRPRGEAWQRRRVLVTGHTGFKGAWLVPWLSQLGAEPIGLALPPEPGPSLCTALRSRRAIEEHLVDLRDQDAVARAVAAARPDVVFHLGAQSLVGEGIRAPVATFATNVMGTANLLEALRKVGTAGSIVVVTSDKCYREAALGCAEDDWLGGDDPYAASKAAAEHVVSAWRHCFLRPDEGIGIATARAGNVIGGGDFGQRRLVPDIMQAFLARQPVRLRAPAAIRPWQHVLDALDGYLQLAEALMADPLAASGAWNFGPPPGDERSVLDVTTAIAQSLGSGEWTVDPCGAPLETQILRLRSDKARTRLGWSTRLPFAQAIDWTVEGYRSLIVERRTDWVFRQIDDYATLDPTIATGRAAARHLAASVTGPS